MEQNRRFDLILVFNMSTFNKVHLASDICYKQQYQVTSLFKLR